MSIDPFSAAYTTGAATLAVAELVAVARQKGGQTITEKTKGTRVTHATMSSLLTWGAFHFAVDDYLDSGLAVNVAVAIFGGALGLSAFRRRKANGYGALGL